jgi:hypothetical protein
MLIRMAKLWSSVDRKQEKPQNYYQKKFQRSERLLGKELPMLSKLIGLRHFTYYLLQGLKGNSESVDN